VASTATWALASSAIRWAMNAPLDRPATTTRSQNVPYRSADQSMRDVRNATSSTPARTSACLSKVVHWRISQPPPSGVLPCSTITSGIGPSAAGGRRIAKLRGRPPIRS